MEGRFRRRGGRTKLKQKRVFPLIFCTYLISGGKFYLNLKLLHTNFGAK